MYATPNEGPDSSPSREQVAETRFLFLRDGWRDYKEQRTAPASARERTRVLEHGNLDDTRILSPQEAVAKVAGGPWSPARRPARHS